MVGPPLSHFAHRVVVAGVLPNEPEDLVRWIRDPQAVLPGNAMPDSGLSEAQARDVAAYLYTLD
jgi:cytochrome c1